MLSLHGFEVTVVCDKQELASYAPTFDDRVASGWIAAEVGKPFTIHIRQTATGFQPQFTAKVYVDGTRCTSRFSSNPKSTIIKGMNPTPVTLVPFQFAPLRIVENPNESDDKNANDMGTLKITIERRVEISSKPDRRTTVKAILKASSTHESNKKRILGGQSIITGSRKSINRMHKVKARPYNAKDPNPHVTFVFKYRSRDYLLAANIIPRDPALSPRRHSEVEDDEEEDHKPAKRICIDDVEQTQSRIRQLKDELRNAEAALADGLDLPRPTVKREPFPFAVGVIVDLTTSDDENNSGRRSRKVARSSNSVIDLTET